MRFLSTLWTWIRVLPPTAKREPVAATSTLEQQLQRRVVIAVAEELKDAGSFADSEGEHCCAGEISTVALASEGALRSSRSTRMERRRGRASDLSLAAANVS
jgi:hypothetical protein